MTSTIERNQIKLTQDNEENVRKFQASLGALGIVAPNVIKLDDGSWKLAEEEEEEECDEEEEEEYKSCPLCGILPQTCDCDKCGIHGCFECITICKEVELCSGGGGMFDVKEVELCSTCEED